MTDTSIFSVHEKLAEIEAVLYRAQTKHPAGFHSGHEGWAVIKEELDELWEHVRADTANSAEARKECIQIAAMALRFIEELHG